jgi:hypothetical protein
MAHSFFIYGSKNGRPESVLRRHAVLVLFGLFASDQDSMRDFLEEVHGNNGRNIHVFDSGLLLGEFEAFAILEAPDLKALIGILEARKWARHGVTLRRFEIYPIWSPKIDKKKNRQRSKRSQNV